MMKLLIIFLHIINLTIIPFLLTGIIRKIKALMQNRAGAPVLQSFYDFIKLLKKGETVSETASYIFLLAPKISLTAALAAAILIPWSGAPVPAFLDAATNFIFVVYLLGAGKFLSLLAAMDTGSSFGGLGASREAYISIMVEPAFVMGFGALALSSGSMNLSTIYMSGFSPFAAVLCGAAFLIAALAELSRMPVDDPTTHLELTMVHEVMILENSGRNLALTEYAVALRTCVFLGLTAQTFLRVSPLYKNLPVLTGFIIGIAALFVTGIFIAAVEGFIVKLNWRRMPNFIAFALALSILAALVAAARG